MKKSEIERNLQKKDGKKSCSTYTLTILAYTRNFFALIFMHVFSFVAIVLLSVCGCSLLYSGTKKTLNTRLCGWFDNHDINARLQQYVYFMSKTYEAHTRVCVAVSLSLSVCVYVCCVQWLAPMYHVGNCLNVGAYFIVFRFCMSFFGVVSLVVQLNDCCHSSFV